MLSGRSTPGQTARRSISPSRCSLTAPSTIPLRLYQTQARFVLDPHRFTAFIGGRGAGKTHAGAVKALAKFERPGTGLVVAPTYPMLRDATWRTALELWAPLIAEVNKAEMRVTMGTGHEVLFRSADDPNRLRGPSMDWVWIDEGCYCPPATWPVVLGVLRKGGRMGQAWLTTTPKGFDWVHEVFVTKANDTTALYQAPTGANRFVDAAFVETLRAQYPAEFARQELGAEFVTLGAGLIRRSWFPLVDHAPAGLTWSRFWDLAASTKASADRTASVRAAEHEGLLYLAGPIAGRWEWPEARRIILHTIAAEPDTETVGVESVAFQLAAVQDLQHAPEALRVAIRGISVDRDKLSRALPWIAKAEAGHIRLVAGAAWSDFLAEAEAFPEGQHDDYCLVAGTMITTSDGDVPIEQIRPGMQVLTRQGYCSVGWSGQTGITNQLMTIDTDSGTMVVATPGHRVWVHGRGFTPIIDLRDNDEVLLCKSKPSALTGEHTAVTLSHRTGIIAFTSSLMISGGQPHDTSIVTSGKHITGRFRMAASSIIAMGTRLITALTTLPAYPSPIISRFMDEILIHGLTRMNSVNTWESFAHLPPNGINLMPAGNGTENMAAGRWRHGNLSLAPVSIAASPFSRSSRQPSSALASAQNASDRPAGGERKNTSVSSAEQPSGAIVLRRVRVRVQASSDAEPQPVYNIQVDGAHEFFANGVLVHNCDAASGAVAMLSQRMFVWGAV